MLKNGGASNCDTVNNINVCTNTGANTNTGTTNSYISIGGLNGVTGFSLAGSNGEPGLIDDGKHNQQKNKKMQNFFLSL
jgi:hypothetical protein